MKEEAETVPYNDLYRNISDYEGDAVEYESVHIKSFLEETEQSQTFVATLETHSFTDEHVIYCEWSGDTRYRDDDNVNLWGIVEGVHTYGSVTGDRTVPHIDVTDMELAE